jgi:hypothetical protein
VVAEASRSISANDELFVVCPKPQLGRGHSLHDRAGVGLSTNWVSEGFAQRLRPEPGMVPISGIERIVVGCSNPFVNVDGTDLRVRPGSDAARPGDSLAPDVATAYFPGQVYVPHQKARALPAGGARKALSALE